MLVESVSSQGNENSARRWFSDEYFDLIFWINTDKTIAGFQLCYDKAGSERALTWTAKSGFSHDRVDTGERNPTKNLSPVLVPDGVCAVQELTERFIERAVVMEPRLRTFVLDKLRAFGEMHVVS